MSQTGGLGGDSILIMTPESLARTVEDFLAGARDAVVLEDGAAAALTFGVLWLDACRTAQAGKVVVEGLKLFLRAGSSALTRERMAHLHQGAAKWQLYELETLTIA